MGEDKHAAATSRDARPSGRLSYEKPAVTWDQPLETQPSLMSGCAKISAADEACNAVFPLGS